MYIGCLLSFLHLISKLHTYCDNNGISTKYFVWGQRFRGNLVSRFAVIIPPFSPFTKPTNGLPVPHVLVQLSHLQVASIVAHQQTERFSPHWEEGVIYTFIQGNKEIPKTTFIQTLVFNLHIYRKQFNLYKNIWHSCCYAMPLHDTAKFWMFGL